MGDDGEIAIVGAGLIGLAIAFELAERGAAVRIYERAEPGRAASWAAAGMLAPNTETLPEGPMHALCCASLAAYPDFVARVRRASGIDPHLHLDGIVEAVFERNALDALDARAHLLSARGVRVERWDRTRTLREEPWLGSSVRGALLLADEGAVDNRRLGRALSAACRARGVGVVEAGAAALEGDGRRVLGVRTERGFSPARWVVNAAGAWAAALAGVPPECVVPVQPVKGQMLALAVPRALVRRVTWVPGAYVVPRDDGRVLVGATVEPGADDARVTANGVHRLLDGALRAAPALGDFTIGECWSGLRPGTPDGLPYLGATPLDGYLLATGHFRNGVLLAPITATLLADAIEGRPPAALAPFRLGREKADAFAASRKPSP